MSYRQIKWLILIIPTLTLGIWEYVRHTYLLPYISMTAGNWFAPVIVFAISMMFLTLLFRRLESMQEELNKAREARAVFEEREKIARELHDGVAQSLFLLSVKVDGLEKKHPQLSEPLNTLRKTVFQVNEYVRQAIANLRLPSYEAEQPWMDLIHGIASDLERDTGIDVTLEWLLPEMNLTSKDKVELYACVREAIINIRKHAGARRVRIAATAEQAGWSCTISDDGIGYAGNPFEHEKSYGLKIMRERANEMGWSVDIGRHEDRTVVTIRKENN